PGRPAAACRDRRTGASPVEYFRKHVTNTRDVRVEGYRPLIPPAVLLDELPLSEDGSRAVAAWRAEIARTLGHADDRLVTIVGPCSVHDVSAGAASAPP